MCLFESLVGASICVCVRVHGGPVVFRVLCVWGLEIASLKGRHTQWSQ